MLHLLPAELSVKIVAYSLEDDFHLSAKRLLLYRLVNKRFSKLMLDNQLWRPLLAMYENPELINSDAYLTYSYLYKHTYVYTLEVGDADYSINFYNRESAIKYIIEDVGMRISLSQGLNYYLTRDAYPGSLLDIFFSKTKKFDRTLSMSYLHRHMDKNHIHYNEIHSIFIDACRKLILMNEQSIKLDSKYYSLIRSRPKY